MSYSGRALSQHQEPRVSQLWTTSPIGQVSIRCVFVDIQLDGSNQNQPDQCQSVLSTFHLIYTVALLGFIQFELLLSIPESRTCTTGPPSDPDRIHKAKILVWCPSVPSISFNCIIISNSCLCKISLLKPDIFPTLRCQVAKLQDSVWLKQRVGPLPLDLSNQRQCNKTCLRVTTLLWTRKNSRCSTVSCALFCVHLDPDWRICLFGQVPGGIPDWCAVLGLQDLWDLHQ